MSNVPDSASVGVPPRNMVFDHGAGQNRLPFFDGNVLTNAMFVVFSGVFPDGERFFLDSVRAFRKDIEDPTLKARVSGFIGQEALHGREHERLNKLFAERGLAVAVPERLIHAALAVLKRAPKRQQLAATIFMEHFTAALAEQWLTDERFHASTEPEAMKLWLWHAVEARGFSLMSTPNTVLPHPFPTSAFRSFEPMLGISSTRVRTTRPYVGK